MELRDVIDAQWEATKKLARKGSLPVRVSSERTPNPSLPEGVGGRV